MNTVMNFINKVEGKLSKHLFTIGYGGTSAIILSNTMRTLCEIDANATTTGFMKILFNVTMFLEILRIAVGVFLAIKGMTNQEEQSSPTEYQQGCCFVHLWCSFSYAKNYHQDNHRH